MTPAQRQRAEVAAELAGARLWLGELRASALRRGQALGQLRDQVENRRVRAALSAAARDVLVVAEAAEAALAGALGDDLAELVAEIPDEVNTGLRAGGGRRR